MAAVLATEGLALPRKVAWRSHVAWLREHFQPGEHISVLVPTGGGKSYLCVNGLLKLPAIEHARVLFVDDKGDDPTTSEFGLAIPRYPLGRFHRAPKPEHYRLLVPDWTWSAKQRESDGVERARQVVGDALEAWYRQGTADSPSILVVDETFALTDSLPPSLKLASPMRRAWRKARYKGLSVIALTQRPAGVPRDFYDQATHLYLGRMQDHDERRRLREIGGNAKVIEEIVATLEDREFLFLGRKGRFMHIVEVGA